MPIPAPGQLKRKTTSDPISLPPIRRPNRQSATNKERRELRKWWADQSLGQRQQKDAIVWFKEKYGRQLSSSCVSDYLSKKYAHLDNANLSKFKL